VEGIVTLYWTRKTRGDLTLHTARDDSYHYSIVELPRMRLHGMAFPLRGEGTSALHDWKELVDWTGFRSHPDEMKKYFQKLADQSLGW
jgi:hypothetical protein